MFVDFGKPEDFAPQVTNPVADVLLKAAQYIREHGWCQFTPLWTGDVRYAKLLDLAPDAYPVGSVCARGGISQVIHGTPWEIRDGGAGSAAEKALAHYLGQRHHMGTGAAIAEWNNASGRTAEEVISALENCAKALMETGR